MSTNAGGRKRANPEHYTDDRCSFPFCVEKVKYRFRDAGVPFCQMHAIDMWSRVNAMMTTDEIKPEKPKQVGNYQGYVYYIRIGDRVKIGHSMEPEKRLATYPPTMEFLLMRLGSRQLERSEHRRFADYLADGREWFEASPEVLARIADLKANLPDSDIQVEIPEFVTRRKVEHRVTLSSRK